MEGSSPHSVVSEILFTLEREGALFHFEGLVKEDLDTEILARVPFMHEVFIGDIQFKYGSGALQAKVPIF